MNTNEITVLVQVKIKDINSGFENIIAICFGSNLLLEQIEIDTFE